MKAKSIYTLWVLGILSLGLLPLTTNAQSYIRYEYWFNNQSNTRTPDSILTTNNTVSLIRNLSMSQLPYGLNTLQIRFKQGNLWSAISSHIVYRSATGGTSAVSNMQYWFDDKTDSVQNQSVTSSNVIAQTIQASRLSYGLHRLNVRFGGAAGYSSVSTHLFYRTRMNANLPVNSAEYWFDDNPNRKTTFNITQTERILQSIGTDSLTYGLHRFNIRFGGASGYSSVSTHLFYRLRNNTNLPVRFAEYWFDDNANRKATFAVSNPDSILKNIGTDSLTYGLHRFNIRFGGAAGYSSVSTHLFYRTRNNSNLPVSSMQYWFDDNSNSVQNQVVTSSDSIVKTIRTDSLSNGLHRVNIRFGGSAGWSSASTHLFYKIKTDTIQRIEYWLDDAFVYSGIPSYRQITPIGDTLYTGILPISVLCDRYYKVNIRIKTKTGWSSATRDSIYLVSNSGSNLIRTDSMKHTSCGLVNGMIAIARPSAGIAPFQYALNQGSFQNAPLFNNLNSGTYTLKVKDATGCQLSKTLIINASVPARIVDTTLTVCDNFRLGDTLLTTSGTYRRILRSASWMGCDSNVTVRLTVNQVRRDTFPPIITCADNRQDSTIYSIIKSREGCDSIIRVVQMRFLPHLTVAFDTTPTCTNRNTGAATLRLNRTLNQVKIRWSTGDTTLNINHLAIGTYTVTITDKTVCNDIRVETIAIRAARTLTASIQKNDACTGQSNGTITVLASGGIAPYRYQWSDSSRTTAVANGLKSALYRVTVTDSLVCDSVQLDVRINEATALESVKKDTFYICQGDTLRVYNRFYTAQGSQEFTYPNLGGCYTSVRVVVFLKATNLNHHLNLVPRDRDTTIQMGDSIRLKLNPNFKPITIHWKPKPCVNCVMMEVKPFSDQTYFVEAQDSQKCVMRDTVSVKVKRGYYDIPNAYYPDRGANYTVYPDKAIQSIEQMRIYDRWGSLMYDSALEGAFVVGKTGWNGKFRDEPVLSGVYVVVVETLLKNGDHETITSDLTIIR